MRANSEARTTSIENKLELTRTELISTNTQLRNLVESRKVLPQQREHGFLHHACPAPAGWEQEAYKLNLGRAAWSYTHWLGDPDEGFGEDKTALERTSLG